MEEVLVKHKTGLLPAWKNWVKATVYVAFAVFIFLSLISYNPNDTSFRYWPANIPVRNLTGIFGAYISEGLFVSLGWSAYLACLLALLWALARITGRPSGRLYIKILATIVLLLSSTILFSLFGAQQKELQFQRAGFIGIIITEFLIRYFGRAGSLIIAAGLGILSSLVSTEFLILSFLRWLGDKFVRFILSFGKLGKLFAFARRGLSKERTVTVAVTSRARTIRQAKTEEAALKTDKPRFQEQPEVKIQKPAPRILKPLPVKAELKAAPVQAKETYGDFKLPPLDLLDSPPPFGERQIKDDLEDNSRILEATLRDFNVETRVTQVSRGPVITRYELEPAPGVKIHRIVELGDDIALAMKAHSVRIVAPIPGKSRVGVEVPNGRSTLVYLKEILESPDFQNAQSKLTLAVGKDISGQPIVTDLADMPHLLIAGTTGSGKTVCVNSIITSMLFNASPDEIKFLMVDPKMVELAMFNDLPHLLCPVLTEPKKVSSALAWVVNEMDERYKLLAKAGTRNIDLYNTKIAAAQAQKRKEDQKPGEISAQPDNSAGPAAAKMPYIIVIIDELADLMVVASQEVENAITRLAQLSRAVGIHLILATQRPSVDVITGVIKANFPARISFRVASKVDSRTVLDANGADKLLGKGDLLFLKPGQHKPVRAQGTLISDQELERIVDFIKKQKSPLYNQQLLEAQERKTAAGRRFEKDELFDEAVKVIMQTKQASVSMLQRRLGLGYTRAARLIDMMEEEGIVGPYRGSKPREILVENNLNREESAELND
jgi:S-DNA-T family DNA segregation ATPase FtsK/SpoIIIE